jgi:hypothetical protein
VPRSTCAGSANGYERRIAKQEGIRASKRQLRSNCRRDCARAPVLPAPSPGRIPVPGPVAAGFQLPARSVKTRSRGSKQ